MALLLASVLTQGGDTAADTLMTVQEESGRWLGGSLMYLLASVGLILGLPSIIVLVRGPGRRTTMAACSVLAVGYVGTAGFATYADVGRFVMFGLADLAGVKDPTRFLADPPTGPKHARP